jgi:hypothetical protein
MEACNGRVRTVNDVARVLAAKNWGDVNPSSDQLDVKL